MNLVAIVLAGGRSSRLGGVPKSGLVVGGQTLLERTLAAVADARLTVVVGDVVVPGAIVTRESPPFGGPAAAIAAGVDALAASGDISGDLVLVLACDMPEVATAVGLLRAEAEARLAGAGGSGGRGSGGSGGGGGDRAGGCAHDSGVAVDADGRRQVLAGVYRGSALVEAIARATAEGPLAGLSVRSLFAGLDLFELQVPESATADIDTWSDARAFGVVNTGADGGKSGSVADAAEHADTSEHAEAAEPSGADGPDLAVTTQQEEQIR